MRELEIRVLEGRWGPQVEYALRYPATPAGNTPFDRFWRRTAENLLRQAAREPGRFPTRFTAEWQETRRDGRFCSGFVDVYRRLGYGDWRMWRVSATFGPQGGTRSLNQLLGNGWQRELLPLISQRMERAAAGEIPFFRGWRRRMTAQLGEGRYYLTDQGLCLWFPQETLAPRSAGLPSILLPYGVHPRLAFLTPGGGEED